jgi:SAM-dependent methyltransferase
MADRIFPSFARYLESKRSVDDRSLNVRVWDRLVAELDARHDDNTLRVLEIGGGVGTMVERMRFASLLNRCHYTLLDSDPDLIDAAEVRLEGLPGVDMEYVVADAFEYLRDQAVDRTWDLLIANAVLDLTDVRRAAPVLLSALSPGGLLYASINYDGVTAFAPTADPLLDAKIEQLYNAAMHTPHLDGIVPTGSRTGRELIPALRDAGAIVLDAGASDWVVFAEEREYHADEAYFLRSILGFIEQTLRGRSELDQDAFHRWLALRHQQIASGELVYIAHQIDILARKPSA